MPSVRQQVAVAILFVAVGVVLQASFTATYGGGLGDQRAVEVDPGNATRVAAHVGAVVDLDERYRDANTQARVAIDTAVSDGRYHTEDASASLYELADAVEDHPYAVYRGTYYRANATVEAASGDDEAVTLVLEPTNASAVLADLAVSYENASAATRAVVDGREPADGMATASVVEKNGTYYAIEFENQAAAVGRLLVAPFVALLSRLGAAYAVVGVAALALLAATRDATPLTRRHLAFALAATVPLAWLTALGVATRQPFAAAVRPLEVLPATGMLAAGHFVARRAWVFVAAGAAVTAVLALVAGAAGYGVVGAVVALPASLAFGVLALPVAWFGARLTPERSA